MLRYNCVKVEGNNFSLTLNSLKTIEINKILFNTFCLIISQKFKKIMNNFFLISHTFIFHKYPTFINLKVTSTNNCERDFQNCIHQYAIHLLQLLSCPLHTIPHIKINQLLKKLKIIHYSHYRCSIVLHSLHADI